MASSGLSLAACDGKQSRKLSRRRSCRSGDYSDPRIAVREALRAGRLIEVLPGYRAEPLSLSLIYPQRRELSRRVNLFMQWLAGVMKEHLD